MYANLRYLRVPSSTSFSRLELAPDSSTTERDIGRLKATLWVGGLTILGLVARFGGIGHQSYWYDEAHTVSLIHLAVPAMLAEVRQTETCPPLYYMLAWCWGHVFGYGEVAIRSLSAVAGVMTVPLAYAVGATAISRRCGLIAAGLTAFNPLLVWYSQEARPYMVMVLLTTVGLLAFAHLRRAPTSRWMLVWVIASAASVATHYYALLVVVPEAVWLLLQYRLIRVVQIGTACVFACFAAMGPFALAQLDGPHWNWITQQPLLSRALAVPSGFVIGYGAPIGGWLILAATEAAATAAWLLVRVATLHERRRVFPWVWLCACGCILVIALIVLGYDQLNTRNLLALWMPAAVCLAAGLSVGARRLGANATVVLCAVGVVAIAGVAANWQLQRPDWRAVARVVRTPGANRALFVMGGCQLLPLSLYLPNLHHAPAAGTYVKELDVVDAGAPIWYDICSAENRAGLPRRVGAWRQAGPVAYVNQFSVIRLRSARPARITASALEDLGLEGELLIQGRPSRLP